MAFVPGQSIPLKEPGAVAGYFELKAPLLRQTHQRAITLAPALLADVASGTSGKHLMRGQWVGRDPNGTWKAIGTAPYTAPTAAAIITLERAVEVAPLLNTTHDPDVWSSGQAAVLDAPFYEARTSTTHDTSFSAGDFVTVNATSGKLDALTQTDYGTGDTVTFGLLAATVGRVLSVENITVNGVATCILTCRFKGTAWSNFAVDLV